MNVLDELKKLAEEQPTEKPVEKPEPKPVVKPENKPVVKPVVKPEPKPFQPLSDEDLERIMSKWKPDNIFLQIYNESKERLKEKKACN